MPDERDIAKAKKARQQNEHAGTTAAAEGEHPEHAAQPGKKTPQEHVDNKAIDESGNLLHPKHEDDKADAE